MPAINKIMIQVYSQVRTYGQEIILNLVTPIIAGRRRLLEGGDYFKYCSMEVTCPKYVFCFIIPLNQKIIKSN